jgi:hypothetical protein
MTSRRARTKDLAGSSHLETFCDRFAGLAASDRLRHGARNLAAADPLTTSYLQLRAHGRFCDETAPLAANRQAVSRIYLSELGMLRVSALAVLAIADGRLPFARADRASRAWREKDDFFRFRIPIRKARSYSRW